MKKTQAPSVVFSNKCSIVRNDTKPLNETSRSTTQLLNLLSNTAIFNPNLISESKHLSENTKIKTSSEENNGTNRKFYNVVWNKQTKKKHKTWEGDGTIEINNDIAILKDTNGIILGRSSKFKNESMKEGCCIFIGNKEVQIVDIINEENCQKMYDDKCDKKLIQNSSENIERKKDRENINCNIQRPIKRLKTSYGNFKVPFVNKNSVQLLMPRPDYSHQWKFNRDKLPINDVKLDTFLSRVLRLHQQEGILFLYSCVTGIRDIKYYGTILSDEMGLGKTLQCISLIWLLLKTGPYGGIPLIKRVLIVTPSSLVTNWLKEFKQWIGFERLQPFIVDQKQKPHDFAKSLPSNQPIMIISYEMIMRHFDIIKDIEFHLLICDEGHRLKNNQIRIYASLSQLQIKRRILLTGTPVQNNLQEFFALVDFVNPGILGQYAEFKKYFEIPIVESNQPRCNDEVKELGNLRAKELNHRTSSFILRRTQRIIDRFLPSKQECVIFCRPSQLQIKLYEAVLSFWKHTICDISFKVPHLSIITILKKICNDPELIKIKEECHNITDDDISESFEEKLLQHLQPIFNNTCSDDPSSVSSGKMIVLESFLAELNKLSEKVVLISYFTQTLNLLETLCSRNEYSYLRLDGSMTTIARSEAIEKFNSSILQYSIFLLSAKAGGTGLNLIGASRLILFDLDWNPASDLQAMSRIWRDGQKKNVYIYRFLTTGSIEEKIYQRQISKTFLSNAVMNIDPVSNARLSIEELKDLFVFKPKCLSLTHDLLMCNCDGNGIPKKVISIECESNNEQRDSQLSVINEEKDKNISKISELIQWEHYSSPVAECVLQELCLLSATDYISCIFRNKYSDSFSKN